MEANYDQLLNELRAVERAGPGRMTPSAALVKALQVRHLGTNQYQRTLLGRPLNTFGVEDRAAEMFARNIPCATKQADSPEMAETMEKTAYEIGVLLALEDAGLLEKTANESGVPWGTIAGSLLAVGLGGRGLAQGLRSGMGRAALKPRMPRSRPTDPRMATYGSQPSQRITFQGQRTPGAIPGRSYTGGSMPSRSYARHQ